MIAENDGSDEFNPPFPYLIFDQTVLSNLHHKLDFPYLRERFVGEYFRFPTMERALTMLLTHCFGPKVDL
jgi:hypothetical protein